MRTNGDRWCAAGMVLWLSMQGMEALGARSEAGQATGLRERVLANKSMSGVDVELRVESRDGTRVRGLCRSVDLRCGGSPADLPEFRIGDIVQVCFRISRAGYVSLWSRNADEPLELIYPNPYEPGDGRVDAGERCVGALEQNYGLRVDGPPGDSLVFLYYTPDAPLRIAEGGFPPQIVDSVQSVAPRPYASTAIRFRTVE